MILGRSLAFPKGILSLLIVERKVAQHRSESLPITLYLGDPILTDL